MLTMEDNKVGPAHLKIASSPSYTLAELETLMRQYVKEHDNGNKLTRELVVSSLLYWLAKREQGKGKGEGR